MGASRVGGPDGPDATRRARFDKLVVVHAATLDVVARKLCGSGNAADLVQDAFERAWRSFDSLHDDASARAWLVRILRNAWFDQLRRRHVDVVQIDEIDEPAAAPSDEPARWERISLNDVRDAIEQLEEPFRTVAVLHDIDGLSYSDIAMRLQIRYATAATRLHRAHARMRELLRTKLEDPR
jgi:RNA polymerase sigma-70 factor (ECF subfamily)